MFSRRCNVPPGDARLTRIAWNCPAGLRQIVRRYPAGAERPVLPARAAVPPLAAQADAAPSQSRHRRNRAALARRFAAAEPASAPAAVAVSAVVTFAAAAVAE